MNRGGHNVETKKNEMVDKKNDTRKDREEIMDRI